MYTLAIRSGPITNNQLARLGFGCCSVSHSRKGTERVSIPVRCSLPEKGPRKTWASGVGGGGGYIRNADRSRESTRGERIGQSGVVWPEESVSLPRRAAGGGGRDEPLASDSGGSGGESERSGVECASPSTLCRQGLTVVHGGGGWMDGVRLSPTGDRDQNLKWHSTFSLKQSIYIEDLF